MLIVFHLLTIRTSSRAAFKSCALPLDQWPMEKRASKSMITLCMTFVKKPAEFNVCKTYSWRKLRKIARVIKIEGVLDTCIRYRIWKNHPWCDTNVGMTSWVPMIFCHYMSVLWWKTSWVFSLDVGIVMKKYTAICSWACSWGCSHACSCLHTSTVMEQHTATCSWACSHSCSHLHKHKWLQAQLQPQLQITFI